MIDLPSSPDGLPPPDPVVEAYKPGIDRTLLVDNLRFTPEERIRRLQSFVEFLQELRRAGREPRERHGHGRED